MGNDGGSIPTRRELVKEAARQPSATELKETRHEQREYHWSTDPLSQKPLRAPVVSDCNGKLYNKDAIIEFLLPADGEDAVREKAEKEKVLLGAVKSLKDVVEVKFQVDEGGKWICPITNKTLGPGVKAVYIVPCGHAFADSVVKEIEERKCLQCNEAYAENDVIPILPTTPTDIARLSLRMKTLKEKGLTHSLKKAAGAGKKRKKGLENGEAKSAEVASEVEEKPAASAPSAGIKNSATASLTAKVLKEQEERNKRRKMDTNGNLQSLFSSRDPSKPSGKGSDFMSRGFSIPANAKR
ncbi:Replication termination factor 2 [Coniosporium apollinis]|uniref:Replication termination factor 2 n=1 Tax=Coniosporium apollinis TaxID=61459 RepID=A0ABQ9NP12_9PEZI|nr:Replication termination factor 2 [Coniosporium apollinis]